MFQLLDHSAARTLALALLHFLWQGALLALLARAGLWLLRRRSPQARYALACAFMALMALAPVATYRVVDLGWKQNAEIAPARSPADVRTAPSEALPAPAGAPAGSPLAPLMPWALGAWAVGVAFLSLRLLGGWLWLVRLRARLSENADLDWQLRLRGLGRRMGIQQGVSLLRSSWVQTPMVVGWLRPAILVPVAAFAGLSPEALEAVLAHELAHIRRHDYLVNLLQSALETLLFYHPAVWWLSAQLRQERELCCDDAAVAVCGDPVLYARALAELEELRAIPSHFSKLAPASQGGHLMNRIRRLLLPALPPSGTRRAGLLAALAVTALGAGTVLHLNGEQAPTVPAQGAAPKEEKKVVVVEKRKEGTRQVKIAGDVKILPDGGAEFQLGDKGLLEIVHKEGGQVKKFRASKEGGDEKRSFTVNGEERPLDRDWLRGELQHLKIRQEKSKEKEAQGHGKEHRVEVTVLGGEGAGVDKHHVLRLHKELRDGKETVVEVDSDGVEGKKVIIEKGGAPGTRREIRIHKTLPEGGAKVLRTEKDGEGKSRVFVFRDGEEQLEWKARELEKKAEELSRRHGQLEMRHFDMQKLQEKLHQKLEGLKGLHRLEDPDFDFDFDFDLDAHPGQGKRIILQPRREDPRREVERLRTEIDRLNRRLEKLQSSLDQGAPPPPPKAPRAPKAVTAPPPVPPPTAPAPPAPPSPKATPAPKLAPSAPPPPKAPAPAPAPSPQGEV
ncbi:MAG: M48 family metalloprotease [Acidobacteria bacterium]|nr:M48 family metalloprotease [Acidobacteriota bacterium]